MESDASDAKPDIKSVKTKVDLLHVSKNDSFKFIFKKYKIPYNLSIYFTYLINEIIILKIMLEKQPQHLWMNSL